DGLPVFSPNGKNLAWTSGRTTDGASQIFTAEWNDGAARRALGLEVGSGKSKVGSLSTAVPDISRTSAEITAADMKQHVTYLASDELGGRLTGTEGVKLA